MPRTLVLGETRTPRECGQAIINPILSEINPVPVNQRIACTPNPICSLIWTALAENTPGLRPITANFRVSRSTGAPYPPNSQSLIAGYCLVVGASLAA